MDSENTEENPLFKDVYEAKHKYRICPHEKFDILSYVPVKSILQKGPQCGLVAVQMILNTIIPNCDITIEQIFEKAKTAEYTLNGEMFSTRNLSKLMNDCYLNKNLGVVSFGTFNEQCIDHLKSGGLLLVPYDADGNHSPCLKKGHKAHWAVINGLVLVGEKLLVTARHGKSKHLAIWELDELLASNSQLEEFSPDRNASNVPYIVPESGLGGPDGLKNLCIFIKPSL